MTVKWSYYSLFHFIHYSKNITDPLMMDINWLEKKSAGSVLIARPAAKGLRIARNRGTSNEEPTPYDNTPKSIYSKEHTDP